MRILIIDDHLEKIKMIMRLIKEISIEDIDIDYSLEAVDGRRKIEQNYYDILILDIMLPDRVDSLEIREDGGIRLIKEVRCKDKYKYPGFVIGITSEQEIVDKFRGEFFSLVYYNPSEEDWRIDLKNYINLAIDTIARLENRGEIDYRYDIAIVCALADELAPVREIFNLTNKIKNAGDDSTYYEGVLHMNGNKIKVVATCSDTMGMTSCSVSNMKIIDRYRPKYLFMTGICAGVEGKVDFGDIIVADPIWNYSNGKYIKKDDKIEFLAEPLQIRLDVGLAKIVEELASDENLLRRIKHEYECDDTGNKLKCHIGAFATGEAVLSSKEKIDSIRTQSRKLLGVDMESYAVHFCGQYCKKKKPLVMTLKSVSDFGDEDKGDNYRKYACYTSAKFLYNILEKIFKVDDSF